VQDFSCLIDDTSYCIKISSSFHESRTAHDTPVRDIPREAVPRYRTHCYGISIVI